jgi:hypothetical protein
VLYRGNAQTIIDPPVQDPDPTGAISVFSNVTAQIGDGGDNSSSSSLISGTRTYILTYYVNQSPS